MVYILHSDDIADIASVFLTDICDDIQRIRENNITNLLKITKILCYTRFVYRLPQALTIAHVAPITLAGQVAGILLDIYTTMDDCPNDHQIALADMLFGLLNIS